MTGTCTICEDENIPLNEDGVTCLSCSTYLWHLDLADEPLENLRIRKCPDCLGTGKIVGRMCYSCESFGVLIRRKSPLERLAEAVE